MEKATEALDRVSHHEELCGERYKAIHSAIGEIKGLLKWGGSLAFATIVGLLAWSLNQQYQNMQQARAADAARIISLERELVSRGHGQAVTVVK